MSQAVFRLYGGDDGNSTRPGDDLFDPRRQSLRSVVQQLIISVMLGLGAFTSFCLLRPKWPQFYYVRKARLRNVAVSALPELPYNFLGWIPALWNVSDADVLAAAGLDAYVFLAFFKMAIRFLFVSSVLAAAVLAPIHACFGSGDIFKDITGQIFGIKEWILEDDGRKKPAKPPRPDPAYLSANLVFVYVFSGLAFYFLWDQTQEIVRVRQKYLGKQATVTDRTIKLSGIPENLRSEGILKEYLEKLRIGKVENISICRQWGPLDRILEERHKTLRKLEEAHTVYQISKKHPRDLEILQQEADERLDRRDANESDEESSPLLEEGPNHPRRLGRPQLSIRCGKFKLKIKKVDAIDYFTTKLQTLDDKITEARRKEYQATPLAFVTFDSVSSAQIAIQTLIDPQPGALTAKQAPSPNDVNWSNVYLSRTSRQWRSWSISISVTLLSLFWLIPVATLAGLLNLEEIRRVWPGLADVLEANEILGSLVQDFLPTLILTLLNVAVPYFYDWLSQYQGLISQEDVELSVISKNFFFTFFNLFLAFTVFGTAFNFHTFWETLKGSFHDTGSIALLLAKAVEELGPFYVNLIILQGFGMFPLRLLQIGTVTSYPISKFGAKTPRDYAELNKPAMFQYQFYLPQPILIFIICIVYSVLDRGVLILAFGLAYFILGYFTYKYQLLYAMDHPRHSTGKMWPMIVYRIILGLVIFQLTMAGELALRQAFTRAGLILPLLIFTVWSWWHYNKTYLPANHYIALKSIRPATEVGRGEGGQEEQHGDAHTLDEDREEGLQFVNPNLVSPLEHMWILGSNHDENAVANGVNVV